MTAKTAAAVGLLREELVARLGGIESIVAVGVEAIVGHAEAECEDLRAEMAPFFAEANRLGRWLAAVDRLGPSEREARAMLDRWASEDGERR